MDDLEAKYLAAKKRAGDAAFRSEFSKFPRRSGMSLVDKLGLIFVVWVVLTALALLVSALAGR